ncbi:MAG: hypothetical protein O2816_01810 [Planctomycetota bacterium]|nr:hypothetical protein [Planctomycetota bacterium]
MCDQVREAPIEVEVERLDPREEERGPGPGLGGPDQGPGARARSFGPIVVGLLLDMADLVTPLGVPPRFSLMIGFAVGFVAAGRLGLPMRGRLMLGAVGAAYCSLAATTTLPIGTLVGALYQFGVFGRRA